MKSMSVEMVPIGDIFLYKKDGEELRAWILLGFKTDPPKAVTCKRYDRGARNIWAESFYSYLGRTKYLTLDMRKHVLA